MRPTLVFTALLAGMLSSTCLAQEWEIGALAGYAWDHDASIRNPTGSVEAGFRPGFAGGAVFGDDPYRYIGGEIRYLYRAGGPQLTAPGVKVSASGFTNVIHYDLLVHLTPKSEKVRPFFAAGAGIKVFTGPGDPLINHPLNDFAVIARGNHVRPLISLGGGVKYLTHRHVQLRLDFRAYMSPCPDELFRTVFPSRIHGWEYDFLPTLGVSYLFE